MVAKILTYLRLHMIPWCDKLRISSSSYTGAVITTILLLELITCANVGNDHMWGFI